MLPRQCRLFGKEQHHIARNGMYHDCRHPAVRHLVKHETELLRRKTRVGRTVGRGKEIGIRRIRHLHQIGKRCACRMPLIVIRVAHYLNAHNITGQSLVIVITRGVIWPPVIDAVAILRRKGVEAIEVIVRTYAQRLLELSRIILRPAVKIKIYCKRTLFGVRHLHIRTDRRPPYIGIHHMTRINVMELALVARYKTTYESQTNDYIFHSLYIGIVIGNCSKHPCISFRTVYLIIFILIIINACFS